MRILVPRPSVVQFRIAPAAGLSTVQRSYLAWRSEPHNQSFSVVRYGHGGDLWNFWLWGSERNRSCGCETAASGAQKRRGPTARAATRAGATLGTATCQCGVVRG